MKLLGMVIGAIAVIAGYIIAVGGTAFVVAAGVIMAVRML